MLGANLRDIFGMGTDVPKDVVPNRTAPLSCTWHDFNLPWFNLGMSLLSTLLY